MQTTHRRIARTLATAAAAASLAWLPVPAQAAPGDSGDVKIHNPTQAPGDPADEPKVCVFYLDAVNFDTATAADWTIDQQPPTGTSEVLSGTIKLTNGAGHTGDLTLPDGHYKLNWNPVGAPGSAKHKVFMVDCASTSPTPTTSPSPTGGSSPSGGVTTSPGATPSGPVGAGEGGAGGGSGRGEIAGGAAMVAAAGALLVRARRRAKRHAER